MKYLSVVQEAEEIANFALALSVNADNLRYNFENQEAMLKLGLEEVVSRAVELADRLGDYSMTDPQY